METERLAADEDAIDVYELSIESMQLCLDDLDENEAMLVNNLLSVSDEHTSMDEESEEKNVVKQFETKEKDNDLRQFRDDV